MNKTKRENQDVYIVSADTSEPGGIKIEKLPGRECKPEISYVAVVNETAKR